jgi:sugar phosphate isomerase/epimerase
MKTIKGPALFLAQFAGDAAPFNSWDGITKWAADCGYVGVQVPSWDGRLFDLDKAASSKTYCDEVKGVLAAAGLEVSELSTHTQGQMVAVHPAYDEMFDGSAPARVRGNPAARQAWAVEQVLLGARASQRMGLPAHVTFSGSLAWPYLYPYPQRPAGLIEEAFDELRELLEGVLSAARPPLAFSDIPPASLADLARFLLEAGMVVEDRPNPPAPARRRTTWTKSLKWPACRAASWRLSVKLISF